MPTIYAATTDGIIDSGIQSSWSNARNASTGTVGSTSSASSSLAVGASIFSGRGSSTYKIWRSFFVFDTTSITGTISSATLKLYFSTDLGSGNVIVVHSDAFTGGSGTLASDDFNNLDFSIPYSAEVDTTSTGLTSITLNAAALAYIKNNDKFTIAVINHASDYNDVAPVNTSGHYVGLRYANYSGTSSDPQIDYTLSTGYANTVIGVTNSNISKVNGVLTASISKVNGI